MADTSTVNKIADLAKLQLSEKESQEFAGNFVEILEFFGQIEGLDTSGVEPLVTPTEIAFHAAEDNVKKFVGAPEVFLEQAPERQGNLYKVPPVV